MSRGTGTSSQLSLRAHRRREPGTHNHHTLDHAQIGRLAVMDSRPCPLGRPGMTVSYPRLSYGDIGHSALAFVAPFGATVTSLPPRFWMPEFFSFEFCPLASNEMPGPVETL